jgi:secreted PhoX family phosphatase
MKLKKIAVAALTTLGVSVLPMALSGCNDDNKKVVSVEFIAMDAPATAAQKADMYSGAKVKYTYDDGSTVTYDLAYHKLFDTTDVVGGNVVGGLFNSLGVALSDNDGQMASDAPDGTSLMAIDGLNIAGATGNPLAMVTQFEYKALPPNDGLSSGDYWSKLPAAMGLAMLDQNKSNGLLTVKSYQNINFSGVNGGWIHCGSTLSGWNTHLGSEEYEPDAKVRGGGAKQATTGLVASDDSTDINSFSKYYFGNAASANPYHYGLVPEVTVSKSGAASVVKHYATGRFAREMLIGADDHKTFIGGDDGKYTGLFMFVADKEKDLSSGTIYAAKVTQTSATNGGAFTLKWIKLGKSSDAEIKALVDGGIKFSDMFDVANTDPGDASYKKVVTYMGTEWLKLKPGMEKAAAFLETRRYAAYLSATTEFSKMEYIAYNKTDKKFYVVISRVETGMTDATGDIQVTRNDGGIILEMATGSGQSDTGGAAINSAYVGTTLAAIPELVGGWNGGTKDAEGNQCSQDKLCGPDNIVFVDAIRTLFIGEDTGRRNNNYVWAYNIDTKKLSRILSTPMYAEATGLSADPNYNGNAYIMSNFQHAGDGSAYTGADAATVMANINSQWGNKKKAAIGYLGITTGALPAFQ